MWQWLVVLAVVAMQWGVLVEAIVVYEMWGWVYEMWEVGLWRMVLREGGRF